MKEEINNNEMKQGKIEYLQMIQEPICRMSTISSIIKGFSATIVASILSFFSSKISLFPIVIGIFFVTIFTFLDTYYLSLERKFRLLFEKVRTDKHDINFEIKPVSNKTEVKEGKARFIDCLWSPSIWIFYLSLFLFLLITLFLKIYNIL